MKNKINDKEILRLFWQVSVPYRRRRNLAIFFTIVTIVISIFVGPLVIAEQRRFKNEMEMYKSCKRYSIRTNNIARRVLGFKTPNEMVEKFFNKVA